MSNKTQLQTNNTNLDALISRVNTAKDTVASLPEAGSGGGGSVEYETVNITENTTTIPFTLKRITATYGMNTENGECRLLNVAHQNTRAISVQGDGMMTPRETFLRDLYFSNNSLYSGTEFFAPYTAVFINDPSQPAIYETTT
jgi:hypothetical protein